MSKSSWKLMDQARFNEQIHHSLYLESTQSMRNTLYHYYYHLLYNNDHASKTSTTHDNTMDQFELQQVKGIFTRGTPLTTAFGASAKNTHNTGCAPSGFGNLKWINSVPLTRSTVLIWNSHISKMGSSIRALKTQRHYCVLNEL